MKKGHGETYLGLFEWTCKCGYGCRCCQHQTWSHKRCDWSWPGEGPLLLSPQVPLEEADCPCWHGDWTHGSGCTYGGSNMLPLPESTRQKATWTPPSRATSAETWFLSPTPTLQTAEGLTGGFSKSDSRVFMEEDVFAVFARSCWEKALRVYRCSECLQKRWRREEREDGESQKERVNTETHSGLVGHLFTVYKDISAWQGAMPNNAIHQSWGSS